jgi:hypothetical protein
VDGKVSSSDDSTLIQVFQFVLSSCDEVDLGPWLNELEIRVWRFVASEGLFSIRSQADFNASTADKRFDGSGTIKLSRKPIPCGLIDFERKSLAGNGTFALMNNKRAF